MPDRVPLTTLGALRTFVGTLDDLPDGTPIHCQVAAEDGGAWYLGVDIAVIERANPKRVAITMTHPELTTMPEWPPKVAAQEVPADVRDGPCFDMPGGGCDG